MMKKTICRFCKWECHLLAEYDENNKVSSLRMDPEAPGIWCFTGKNVLDIVNNPARLRQPLQRCGAKGENQWRSIPWDEAIAIISREYKKIIAKYGRESLFFCTGYNKPLQNNMLERLANVLQLPNRVTPGNMCYVPRIEAYKHTFGFMPQNDISAKTKNILLWGYNPGSTNWRDAVVVNKAVRQGTRLIVIDPLETNHAKGAFKWLPVKAGTDLALIQGMINIIIQEQWYDSTFINQHTEGFTELVESLRDYTLARTSILTGLAQEDIRETARLFALERPSVILSGNAVEHNFDSFQKNRAFTILTAITGNVDMEGALLPDKTPSSRNMLKSGQLAARHLMDTAQWGKRVGKEHAHLSTFYDVGGQDIVRAVHSQKPYPIKGGYVLGGNPVMTWADSKSTATALAQLDFLAVADYFMTPTAMLADIVLPAATYLEVPGVSIDADDNVFYVPQLIDAHECKSDMEIINSMGNAMGYEKYFWPEMNAFWDTLLAPYNITLAQLKEIGTLNNKEPLPVYQTGTYRKNGFPTDNGKIALFSKSLASQGVPPLPEYAPLYGESDEYPYYCTNYKSIYYYHSAGRQIKANRLKEDKAIAYVSSDIATKENIAEGDTIVIETPVGKVLHQASLTRQVASNTVVTAHGWWYPEEENNPFHLKACINNLTSLDENLGQDIPAFSTRGLCCRVYKK